MVQACLSRMVVVGVKRVGPSTMGMGLHTSPVVANKMGKADPKLVLSSTTNNVTTLTMNDPKKLNGWTGPMMLTLADRFKEHASNPDTKVLILTGADPYYCAGVNL